MKPILSVILITIASSLTQSTLAQAPAQEVRRTSYTTNTSPKAELTTARAKVAMFRIQGYVDRVLSFRDVEVKVYTLTALGDMVWKYDEPFARRLFLQAYDFLKAIKITEPGAASSPVEGTLSAARFADLRDEFISSLARRDTVLSRRLSTDSTSPTTDSERAMTDQRTAMNLLGNGESAKAVEFAERSMSAGVPQQMIGFLLQLRRSDERKADELYLQTLNRLLAEPNVDGMRLMQLGVYVFTSPLLDPAMEERGAMVVQSVGNVGVVNLSADRPGISPQVVRAYLSTVAQILARPISDPQQQKLYYVAGRQLLPKAQRFAPNLAPRIAAAIQSFIPSVPPVLMQASTYDELGPNQNYTFDDTLREIDEINDEALHDLQCVTVANGLSFSEDFAHAHVVAERVKGATVRSRLINLIGSFEAAKIAGKGETDTAEEMARKLAPGIERAILWIEIARARLKEDSRSRALESFVAALKDARELDDARRPFVMLSVAGELAQLDTLLASQTFNEAVKLLNNGDGKLPKWSETIEVGGRPFSFSLRGIEGNVINSATLRLFSIDAQGTQTAIYSLKHERILGNALRALSESVLTSVPPAKKDSTNPTDDKK
jgi:hypothetical protein